MLAEAQKDQQSHRGALRRHDPAEAPAEERQPHPVEQDRPQEGQPDRQVDELQEPDPREVEPARPQDQRRPARQEAERGPEGHVQAEERGERAQGREAAAGVANREGVHHRRTDTMRAVPVRRYFGITLILIWLQ